MAQMAARPTEAPRNGPLISSTSGAALTWDGRLDNRRALALELELSAASTDSSVVLAAIDRWGTDAFRRLVGDWCLACWLPHARRLLLACDEMGTRPLFHVRTGRLLYWSTQLASAVRFAGLASSLSSRYAIGYLTRAIPPTLTPFEGLYTVPSAHFLACDADGRVSSHRFWDFRLHEIKYSDKRDYSYHLCEHVSTAVARRAHVEDVIFA